ncbi:MAG TPA: tRNA (N(6)-L-threonylcarbamoyladenosine(37)-C(2))-methylthiotransferase MtaB, partial [Hyphomonas sp.]
DAIEIDDALMETMAEPRLAPFMHLSLQHGDDLILKRMKRRHLRADAIALTDRLRAVRPDIAFGADIIAGFPTETEAHFENSARLVEECGLSFLHVFPYSPRPGTPAARMPQLDKAMVKTRAARLRDVGAAALERHLRKYDGQTVEALVERGNSARLPDFTPVQFESDPGEAGRPVRARIVRQDGKQLIGALTA